MKRNRSKSTLLKVSIPAMVIILTGLWSPQRCLAEDVVLLLQQSSPQGGTVTPEVGIHRFEIGTNITLTATPKPGYQFVCWLGDVSDPKANSTIVYLDSPKIVIAVFERLEYESLTAVEFASQSTPIGGITASGADYARTQYRGGAGRRPRKFRWPQQQEQPEPPDFPVPEEGDDFPVPVPEPGTAGLLIMGSLILLRRRENKIRNVNRTK